jgi:hypothetical protein
LQLYEQILVVVLLTFLSCLPRLLALSMLFEETAFIWLCQANFFCFVSLKVLYENQFCGCWNRKIRLNFGLLDSDPEQFVRSTVPAPNFTFFDFLCL